MLYPQLQMEKLSSREAITELMTWLDHVEQKGHEEPVNSQSSAAHVRSLLQKYKVNGKLKVQGQLVTLLLSQAWKQPIGTVISLPLHSGGFPKQPQRCFNIFHYKTLLFPCHTKCCLPYDIATASCAVFSVSSFHPICLTHSLSYIQVTRCVEQESFAYLRSQSLYLCCVLVCVFNKEYLIILDLHSQHPFSQRTRILNIMFHQKK